MLPALQRQQTKFAIYVIHQVCQKMIFVQYMWQIFVSVAEIFLKLSV